MNGDVDWNDWKKPGMHVHFDAGDWPMASDDRNLTVCGPADA